MTLIEYLNRYDLTCGQFGARIGRDRTQVWRWANGKRVPDLETAILIEEKSDGAVPPRSFLPAAAAA